MKIKMLESIEMSANESGNVSKKVEKDEIVSMDKAWQKPIAESLVSGGLPKITKKKSKKKVSK
jgi:hypothetical protein